MHATVCVCVRIACPVEAGLNSVWNVWIGTMSGVADRLSLALLPLSLPLLPQATQDQQLDCALDLMRRLPPQQIEKNLSDLIDLVCGARTPHMHTSITLHSNCSPLHCILFSEYLILAL